jgi:tRNA (guanine-N7-)-methyltransferase
MMREVVSFVRRGERMNPSQQRAWDALSGFYVLDVPPGRRKTAIAADAQLDFAAAFGREAPLLVEVGSGDGATLEALAAAHPEANLLGFEVFLPTVASTLSRLDRAGLKNVRMLVADAQQAIPILLGPESVAEVWTFFPDPWHKARHHKRRLVNPGFARTVARVLVPGGRWRLATDWEDYAIWIREVLDAEPQFAAEFAQGAPRFAQRPVTRFEQRAIDAGRTIVDMSYVKVGG